MKPKIITTLLCLSLMSASTATERGETTCNILITNKLTHVWMNVDEPKAGRTDALECPSFDPGLKQVVLQKTPFNPSSLIFIVGTVVTGVTTLYQWWSTPQPAIIYINR